MKRFATLLLIALITAAMALPASAAPEPARTFAMNDVDAKSESFTSAAQVGTGTAFFLDGTAGTYECQGTLDSQCERTFVAITGLTDAEIAAAGQDFLTDNVNVNVGIGNYSVPVADFDLIVFAADENGKVLSELGRSGNNPGDPENVTTSVRATSATPTKYIMIEVVVFASPGSTYDMSISVS